MVRQKSGWTRKRGKTTPTLVINAPKPCKPGSALPLVTQFDTIRTISPAYMTYIGQAVGLEIILPVFLSYPHALHASLAKSSFRPNIAVALSNLLKEQKT